MTVRFLGVVLFCSLLNSVARADDAVVGSEPTVSMRREAERSRIQAERAQAEASFKAEESACYARFTVSDCISKARRVRREVLETLRKQEIVINDADRQQKALEQIERIKEKSSEQKLQEDAARRLEAQAAQKEREANASEKAIEQAKPKSGRQVLQLKADQGRSANEIAREQKQYADKLKEAEAHRASVLKGQREKASAPKKPLPTEP